MTSSSEPSAPLISRLLSLPAELRLRIYQEALTAPDAAIRMYFSFQRNHRVQPRLGLGLLRTCRQIHAECQEVVVKENAVFAYADCFQPSAPAIGSSQLPPPALHTIRTLFLVLDVSEAYDSSLEALPSPSSLSNFAPLAQLAALRRLRVAVVARRRFCQGLQWWKALLGCVIERVPPECRVEWGSETGAQRESNGLEEAVLDIFSANNLLPLVAAESERGGG
ncbi:hypothetical protein HDK77DRAFT_494091 [Phyllosticta capitalensis]|uniref:Uncharacterized protein n=1 Tax=Phyllosticta capitalensis TaxID=121624 RepID=A0ABR1YKC5_9PEZI